MLKKNFLTTYLEELAFVIKRAGWKVTKIHAHLTFEQKRFKQKFILVNQKSRQESKNDIEKDFYKLMNNSNFGYDCRNNLDNCKFVPIFDELKELTYIERYHNIFDPKISKFVTADLIKQNIEATYNDKLIKLDKEDKFYQIKLDTLNTKRLTNLEVANSFENKQKKNKRKLTLNDYDDRKNEAFRNQKIKSFIDFDEKYSSSIKSIAIEKSTKVNLTTRFLNGKMLMFSKVSIKSFAYDLIDVFMFPNQDVQKIYQKYKINKCYLYQNLTDTDSTSLFFIFICDLNCCIKESDSRNIIFEVMITSKVFDRLDLSADFWKQFDVQNKKLKKQVGLFEIENIDKPNVITIALNPKEYYERFNDHSDNRKHKGLHKSTRSMDLDSYSERLSDLNKFSRDYIKKPPKKLQKTFQIIHESIQMKSVNNVQFGQLNDKRFYFSNGLISLPFGHPYLENLRKEKHKYRAIHKAIQEKKYEFLKEESKVLEKIPRLHILKQIFSQNPILYVLNANVNCFTKGWKSTKELIINGSWK